MSVSNVLMWLRDLRARIKEQTEGDDDSVEADDDSAEADESDAD